ncbi:2OG-Fe dioxygenase family protein [Lyngbya confervoides]|uniref:2OG-Fe dioxygenase family protein n=1 Tax=Lyngbya confervoides BDU141951 TaxID=1574623 RepID=A0ABD4T6C8_9CYAN|nr:2OG-Fe dioxygenase family protein [Lyngbya confervoides]MCM1983998.1 2OG-Fe dioxygenase family protein [Lyngbya confervoides BDU141951]
MGRNLLLEQFNCLTDYAVESLNTVDLGKIRTFFNAMPVDPYLAGRYRSRRLSRFQILHHKVHRLDHQPLFQSKAYNPLLGDVYREFAELEEGLVQLPDFHKILLEFFEFCRLCSDHQEIGVHQIRTLSSPFEVGQPAPEGIHRDGVDLVGIFSVTRDHIYGGETSLYRDKSSDPIFTKILNPGELCVFNDHQFFHYTTDIHVTPPAPEGLRDVFVLTCPGLTPPTP